MGTDLRALGSVGSIREEPMVEVGGAHAAQAGTQADHADKRDGESRGELEDDIAFAQGHGHAGGHDPAVFLMHDVLLLPRLQEHEDEGSEKRGYKRHFGAETAVISIAILGRH